jgi:hypothetical protein
MAMRWINFVKEYADKNKITFGSAMASIEARNQYYKTIGNDAKGERNKGKFKKEKKHRNKNEKYPLSYFYGNKINYDEYEDEDDEEDDDEDNTATPVINQPKQKKKPIRGADKDAEFTKEIKELDLEELQELRDENREEMKDYEKGDEEYILLKKRDKKIYDRMLYLRKKQEKEDEGGRIKEKKIKGGLLLRKSKYL